MQVNYRKGETIVKLGKQELGWVCNMIGMMRHLQNSAQDTDAKAAADALEKVRSKYTKEAAT